MKKKLLSILLSASLFFTSAALHTAEVYADMTIDTNLDTETFTDSDAVTEEPVSESTEEAEEIEEESDTDEPAAMAGEESSIFDGGLGTENEPYLISTKEQLNLVRNYMECSFRLTSDLYFTEADFAANGAFYNNGKGWSSLGYRLNFYNQPTPDKFTGIFDGNNHTIYGLTANQPDFSPNQNRALFEANQGTIKNLTVEVNISNYSAGAAIALANEGTIENCASCGQISTTGSAGGIVNSNSGMIRNCVNHAVINGRSNAGGIVGYRNGGTVAECTNDGEVFASYAAGIVSINDGTAANSVNTAALSGYQVAGIAATNYDLLQKCTNEGVIRTKSYSNYNKGGGICGANSGVVDSCDNYGDIQGGYKDEKLGGITGMTETAGSIVGCSNYGSITNDSDGGYSLYAGGICGYNQGTLIEGCSNAGEVILRYRGATGGVVAYTTCSSSGTGQITTIRNCSNSGHIDGQEDSAGIIGEGVVNGSQRIVVTNCYNTGSIHGKYTGGVLGYLLGSAASADAFTVEQCYNSGCIEADYGGGGIAGSVPSSGPDLCRISNCFNTETVTGSQAGGIVGGGSATIDACYNIGMIISDSNYAGAIIGWKNSSVLSSCYYLDNMDYSEGYKGTTASKCTLNELKSKETYVGFDFGNIWEMRIPSSYPLPVLSGLYYEGKPLDEGALEITVQPVTTEGSPGFTASFRTVAQYSSGTTTGISYQWQYSKNGGAKWVNSSAAGSTTDTLSVKVTKSNSVNIYRCVVTGTAGEQVISDTAGVELLPEAVITLNPRSNAVEIGEYATFTVETENAASFQWQYSKDGAHWYRSNAEGNQTDTLLVKGEQKSQGNRYRCLVTGIDGNTKKSYMAAMIVMTVAPKDCVAEVGQVVSFSLKAEGIATYQWQYSKDGGQTWYKSNAEGATTDTVTFKASVSNREMIYRCRLTTVDEATAYTRAVGTLLLSQG